MRDGGEASRQTRAVIRDAVLHLTNEQPLLVDLFEAPRPGDVTLVCTNLRQLNGRRPVFVDRGDSVFVFPYAQIRFVEVPRAALATEEAQPSGLAAAPREAQAPGEAADGETVEDVDLDPAFLERIREF